MIITSLGEKILSGDVKVKMFAWPVYSTIILHELKEVLLFSTRIRLLILGIAKSYIICGRCLVET